MVSLEFFIDVILRATLWSWGSTQPLTEISTRNISWGTDNLVILMLRFSRNSGLLNLLEP